MAPRQRAQVTNQAEVLPEVEWTLEDYQRLVELGNPTTLAALELCAAQPGEWVSYTQVAERAGRTTGQARGDLAGLTVLVKRRFARSNRPFAVGYLEGGIAQYRMSEAQADMWCAAIQEPAAISSSVGSTVP